MGRVQSNSLKARSRRGSSTDSGAPRTGAPLAIHGRDMETGQTVRGRETPGSWRREVSANIKLSKQSRPAKVADSLPSLLQIGPAIELDRAKWINIPRNCLINRVLFRS